MFRRLVYETVSEVFGKSVTVRILDTIVNGATECSFEISEY